MKKLLLIMFAVFFASFTYAQECTDLFISEYVEGSGNNKAVEIYNPTDEEIDLSIYTVKRYSNGSPFYTDEVQLSGTIQSKGVVVVTNGQTDSVWVSGGGYWSLPVNDTLYDKGNLHCSGIYPTAMYFNGNDALTLEKITGEVVDIFGKIGSDPGSNGWNDLPPTYVAGDQYWTSWTKDQTLIRKFDVKDGVLENPAIFMVNTEWDSIAKNNFDSLGFHRCDCGSLGITEKRFHHSVVMYPNPSTSQRINISASEKIEFVTVINNLGQVVHSEEIIFAQENIHLEGSFLRNGLYIVTIRFIDKSSYSGNFLVHSHK